MIGVDPHKASHTAVAVGGDEQPLGQVRVRASALQAMRLLEWAAAWPDQKLPYDSSPGQGERARHGPAERPLGRLDTKRLRYVRATSRTAEVSTLLLEKGASAGQSVMGHGR